MHDRRAIDTKGLWVIGTNPFLDDCTVVLFVEKLVDVLDAFHDAAGGKQKAVRGRAGVRDKGGPRHSGGQREAHLHITSSFTALAFEPGVLNTGMPSSVSSSTGMLLVPAPHRAMARVEGGTSET